MKLPTIPMLFSGPLRLTESILPLLALQQIAAFNEETHHEKRFRVSSRRKRPTRITISSMGYYLIYGRYLQFRFLKWPLISIVIIVIVGYSYNY